MKSKLPTRVKEGGMAAKHPFTVTMPNLCGENVHYSSYKATDWPSPKYWLPNAEHPVPEAQNVREKYL